MSEQYFSKYHKTSRQTADIFQAMHLIIQRTQDHLRTAQDNLHNDQVRIKACSDSIFNISLILKAIDSKIFEPSPYFQNMRKFCVMFIELLRRANMQKNSHLFEKLDYELDTFKAVWSQEQAPYKESPSEPKNSGVAVHV